MAYDSILRDSTKQDNYETAYRLACDELARMDIEKQCEKAGARLTDQGKGIILRFLNRDHLISYPDIEVSFQDGEGEVTLWEKIVIIHYLVTAKGTKPAGELISYKQVPDGRLYYPNFVNRTTRPLIKVFGKDPSLLLEAAGLLGGTPSDYGDYAVTIPALPRVAVTTIIWTGDDEFPPDANMIFDANIVDYLPAEDITVLCNMIALKLMKYQPTTKGNK
ncbi:MAG: DUF3786 domain-containing protein [Deltaproteobacteria bacterium]|nr:MAG: DUF3786 domain-containing protein [Deltaproteobacteria bacterium]